MMFEAFSQLLDSFLETGIPGYDCAIYRDGKCIYRRMGGYSDLEARIPVNGRERYTIYSSSKMITCTAALMLMEKGLFRLEDPLGEYMPEFREMQVREGKGARKAKKSITIRDLFCMTAGFSYSMRLPMIRACQEETGGRCPTREAMRYLAKEPLLCEPGEKWIYSFCHDVLAALTEVLSGMRFGEYVKKTIFEPLGMEQSNFLLDDGELDTVCPQYQFDPRTGKTERRTKAIGLKWGSEYESGGAGCVTTLDDFMKFLEGLRSGKLLRADTLEQMTTNQLTKAQEKIYRDGVRDDTGYGLGVCCSATGENGVFGWGGAAGTYPMVDRRNGLSFFYVQHVLGTDNDRRNLPMHHFFTEELPAMLPGI